MPTPAPDPYLMRVAANIIKTRKARGMSRQQLAVRAEIHHVRLGRIERGIQNFNMATLRRLALGLSVPPAELLVGADLSLLRESLLDD